MSNNGGNILKLAENSKSKAIYHLENNNAGRALAHFLVALNLVPEWKENLEDVFISTIDNFGNTLLSSGRLKEYVTCYGKALEVYPENIEILKNLADVLVSMGHFELACGFYQKCVNIDSTDCMAQKASDSLKNTLVERWHFRMLNDIRRNSAFMEAIMNVTKNTDTVLDIGCGTGILSLFASKAMPKIIHATDYNETMYNISKSVFKENSLENIKVYNEKSSDLSTLKIVEKVSLIITEIFDGAVFGEGVLQELLCAHEKLLEKSGRILPRGASLFICGVRSHKLARKHRFIYNGDTFDGLKFGDINIIHGTQEPYDTEDMARFEDLEFVTDVQKFLEVDFLNPEQMENLLMNEDAIKNVNLDCINGGTIDAFIVWFELILTDTISITTDPRSCDRSKAWEQTVFHLNSPIAYNQNSRVSVKINCVYGRLALTVLNHNYHREFDHSVSSQTIKVLNDFAFISLINKTVGAACVHISQTFNLSSLKILDMTSFPIFGLLFLARGAHHLTCSTKNDLERDLIVKIAAVNNIMIDRIRFVNCDFKESDIEDDKFEIIVNNYFSNTEYMCELNHERIYLGRSLRIKQLHVNGLMMPFNIRMMARVIYSSELNRINKLDDRNVFNYKIAQFLNMYSVSQNIINDMSTFPYENISEDLVLFEQCLHPRSDKIVDVIFKKAGSVNAVLTWFEIQLMRDSQIYSTLVKDSPSECCIHIIDEMHADLGEKYSLIVLIGENDFIKISLHHNFES